MRWPAFRMLPLLLLVVAAGCPSSSTSGTSSRLGARCNTTGDCGGGSLACCAGVCVDLASNPASCGACGAACSGSHVQVAGCSGARCQVSRCAAGFFDCNGRFDDGCEVDGRSDTGNCGGCGIACQAGPNQHAGCADGACRPACDPGRLHCSANPADGCEVDLATDVLHCGNCATACATPHGAPACAAGHCAVGRCDPGFADCNGFPEDGCEAELARSVAHCGACGHECPVAYSTAACVAGSCAVANCAPGHGDCNGDPLDGCEVDLSFDTSNCGACGTACPSQHATPTCQMGGCAIAACAMGWADCDREGKSGCEISILDDASNCGGCGMRCAPLPHAAPGCRAGVCALGTCDVGFADCDGNPANGCETDLGKDAANCGTCGRSCSLPNASAVCAAGLCKVGMCNPGWGNCDGTTENGCETDLGVDPRNCGACGQSCAAPNAIRTCSGGVCGPLACNAGFSDCDGNAVNGCEANIATDLANCGGCGQQCGAKRCDNGQCGDCLSGADCDPNSWWPVCDYLLRKCNHVCDPNKVDTSECPGGGCCGPGIGGQLPSCRNGLSDYACGTGGNYCTDCTRQAKKCVRGACQ